MEVFSTITSPVFTEIVSFLTSYAVIYLPREVALFETLRKMYKVRPFKLVFLLDVDDFSRRELAEALRSLTTISLLEFFDFLDSPPTIRVE
jgi:hypothetical protein